MGSAKEGQPMAADEDVDLKRVVKDRRVDDMSYRKVMWFVVKLLAKHPFLSGASILLTFLLAGAEVFSIALFFPFLDALTGDAGAGLATATPLGFLVPYFQAFDAVEKVRFVAVLLVATELLKGVMLYLMTRVGQYLTILIARDIRMQVFDEMMSVDLGFINRQRTSNLFTILHSFPTAATAIASQILMGLQNATSFIALVVSLLLIDWQLTLLAGVLALIVNFVIIRLAEIVRARAKDITESRLELHRTTLEALQSIKTIHLFGRIGHARGQFLRKLTTHQRNQYRKATISSVLGPLQSLLNSFLVAAVLIGATFIMVREGAYWVALLASFMVVVMRFMGRSGKFAKRRAAIAEKMPAVEAVIDFLERPDKTYLVDGSAPFDRLERGIRFEDVDFRYAADAPVVLQGIDLEVPRGKMVALVGGSGSGKSTLVDLVARLYDPAAGRITVDGRDLREIRLDDWRRRIAVVSQHASLFNQSVRENIRFGRLDATDAEVEEAARLANAHDFIVKMPDGYDTEVGDQGSSLSGGQAQRIAIARAILADPQVLILDEATSALDTETEHLVQQAVDRIGKDRTIIAVAHRLSTIRRADQIVVLEEGRIVERGTHDVLLAAKGRYARYVELQDLTGTIGDGSADTDADAARSGVENLQTVLEAEMVLRAKVPGDVAVTHYGSSAPVPVVVRLDGDASSFVELVEAQEGVAAVRAEGRTLRILWRGRRAELALLVRDLIEAGAVPLSFGTPPRDHDMWAEAAAWRPASAA